MGKFSDLAPAAQGRYVDAEDKAALMENAVALQIIGTTYQPKAMFGPRWLVGVAIIATGETLAIDFAAANAAGEPIATRMAMFGELTDRLADGERFDPVILSLVSREGGGNPFWTFREATDDEIANSRKEHSAFTLDAKPAAKPKMRKAAPAADLPL